jgi:hypothetical protein
MELDAIAGALVLLIAISLITGLVLWSRRTVDRIARDKLRHLRDIKKELANRR